MDQSAARSALLTTLSHLAERLDVAATPADLLTVLADGARGILPFSASALALPDPWRVWRAAAARPSEISFNDAIPAEAQQTLERFLAHGQPLYIADLLVPPWSEASHRNVLWKDGTRSAVLAPLVSSGQTLGALSFTSLQPNRYPLSERDAVALLAWMAATTLRRLTSKQEAPP